MQHNHLHRNYQYNNSSHAKVAAVVVVDVVVDVVVGAVVVAVVVVIVPSGAVLAHNVILLLLRMILYVTTVG